MKRDKIRIRLYCGNHLRIVFTVLITLGIIGGFSTGLYATFDMQPEKITLNLEKATFSELVRQLEANSRYTFLYREDQVRSIKSLNMTCSRMEIDEILQECLSDTNLTYRIVDHTIIIVPIEKQNEIKHQKVIGSVVDKQGQTLPGVTILLKGTTLGCVSDADGNFEITIPMNGKSVLLFSFVGMENREIQITDTKPLKVVMQPSTTEIDEVVVTGIFNKAKESYTGSVSSISSKELKMYKGQNLLSTLRNIDPSINIIANNLAGSNPNRLPEVNIRGNSSLPMSVKELNEGASQQLNAPVVIMDGFEISLQKLLDFNDEEIESINILKDAAATAIYGSRGANGIIVITTKAPQAGRLRIFAQGGVNIEIPDLTSYDLLNARDKLELERMVGLYNGSANDVDKDRELKLQYNERLADVLGGVDTYWLSEPLRTGVGQKYNLRLEGGSNEFRWGTSLSYNTIAGVMKGSERNTFSGSITLSYSYKNIIFRNQTVIDFNEGKESKYGVFSEYAKMNPYFRPKDQNGEYIKSYQSIGRGYSIGNPLHDAQLNIINKSKYNQLTNNFSIEWNMNEALRLRAQLGISKLSRSSDYYLPANHSSFEKTAYESGDGFFRKGIYDYMTGEETNIDANVTLNYSKTFNNVHQVYVGIDGSMAQAKDYQYTMQVEGFPNEDLDFFANALQYAKDAKPSGIENITRRVGLTGNMNYTYDNRYFIDFSYRVDGSSQFGTDNKFAPFWSTGLGWNIHNEAFFNREHFFNKMRLRASIGESGSQQFNAYEALKTLKYYSGQRYLIWYGAELMGLGNENLKWQTTQQFNIGTEIALFNNRMTVTFDFYNKTTKDLLSQMDLPLVHGFPSYTENVGEVRNRGYEAILGGYIIRNTKRDMMWTITAKLAYNKNTITKLSQAIKDQNEIYLKQEVEINNLLYEGRSQNSIYAVQSLGIDPSTGEEIFLDADGNITDKWNPSAKKYMGVDEPLYRGNLSSMFSYKNLTLNLSFGYHWGGYLYNETLLNKVEVTNAAIQNNVDRRVFSERWQKPGDIKQFKGYGSSDTKATSRFVMPDRVFELQSVSLQYQLTSQSFTKHLGIDNMTFGVNMSDLFYITSVKQERGIAYPFARRMTCTLSLMF